MPTDAQQAKQRFEASQRILKEASSETRMKIRVSSDVIDHSRRIRAAAERLCDLLEAGGDLDAIDRTARLVGAEALGVQSFTLRARARVGAVVEEK